MGGLAEKLSALSVTDRVSYLHYLVSDLTDIGETEKAHHVITQPDWMRARVVDSGHYDGFLQDVDVVWKRVAEDDNPTPGAIGRLIHYALLRTVAHSVAGSLPPLLISTGLELGFWGVDAAFGYADKLPYPELRVDALIRIGAVLNKQRNPRGTEVLTEALMALRGMEPTLNYKEAFEALAAIVPVDLMADAFYMAASIPHADWRASILSILVPRLPPEMTAEALESVDEIRDEIHRGEAFAALVPHLSPDHLDDMLEKLEHINEGYGQAVVLLALASRLPAHRVDDAKSLASSIRDVHYSIAAALPYYQTEQPDTLPALLQKALQSARRVRDGTERARSIALLAPYFPPDMLHEALALAHTIGHPQGYELYNRARAFVALAPYLPPELQREVIADVRQWDKNSVTYRAQVVRGLAPHLGVDLLSEALTDVRETIRDIYHRDPTFASEARRWPSEYVAGLFEALAPSLPPLLFNELVALVPEVADAGAQIYALIGLAPYLPQELLQEAVQVAREITGEYSDSRVMALAALSLRGLPQAFEEALAIVQGGQENDESLVALPLLLSTLSSALPTEQQQAAITEALAVARHIRYPRWRSEALAAVATQLPLEQRAEVVAEAESLAYQVEASFDRTVALTKLLPWVAVERRAGLVSGMLDAAQEFDFDEEPDNRTVATALLLPSLAAALPPSCLEDALNAARRVPNPQVRGDALAVLAPHISADQRTEVLTEALQAAREIDAEHSPAIADRVKLLALVAAQLPAEDQAPVIDEALSLAENAPAQYRSELSKVLATLVPLLQPDSYPRMVELARETGSAEAMAALAALQAGDQRQALLQEAVLAAQGIGALDRRAEVLAMLTTLVEMHDLPEFVKSALAPLVQLESAHDELADYDDQRNTGHVDLVQLRSLNVRLAAFRQLAPGWSRLPTSQAYEIWKHTLYACATQRRNHFLTDLVVLMPVIETFGGRAVLTETYAVIAQVCVRQMQAVSVPH
jgi:hypothetical protein